MEIAFTGKSNIPHGGMYVNNISVVLPSGEAAVVDRDVTEWSMADDGAFSMVWRSVYVVSGDDILPVPADFDRAEIVGVEIEDDAPDGYEITFDSITIIK